ncbi:redoxin domain-containing protein [Candidatus Woesearchaeota archaeon]|nr:redoxin domain-containing protein [Candidatus Woesearchaeota archaeon]
MNTVVVGVRKDSATSHCVFIEKHQLTLRYLVDENHTLMERRNSLKKTKLFCVTKIFDF